MKKKSDIQKRHEQIGYKIAQLSEQTSIMPGNFRTVFVKCGTPTCWCVDGKGHPFNRITWTEKGKSRTKSIPVEDIPWIKEVTQNYRNFKKFKREIKSLETKLKMEIEKWESQLVRMTRKTKEYLKNL